MKSFQDQKSLILSYYDELEAASAGSVKKVISQFADQITNHFFCDGDYVGVTGWPNMIQTLTDGGWMGVAPSGKRINLRSLDFWRVENGLIRENWVLVDLLDIYDQIGVDVFARLREFNKARRGFDPKNGVALN